MIVPGVKPAEILGQLWNLLVVDVEVEGVDHAPLWFSISILAPSAKGMAK